MDDDLVLHDVARFNDLSRSLIETLAVARHDPDQRHGLTGIARLLLGEIEEELAKIEAAEHGYPTSRWPDFL